MFLEVFQQFPREYGDKLDQQAFQVEGGWLDAIGYSKFSAMESIEPDW